MSRILLIEDDDAVRMTLRLGLVNLGHKVVEAENGSGGLALFKAQPVDLVVTDIVMPDGEGVETIRALRKISVEVPIIAISGDGEYLQDLELFGATETLEKPFEIGLLQAAIVKSLGNGAGR